MAAVDAALTVGDFVFAEELDAQLDRVSKTSITGSAISTRRSLRRLATYSTRRITRALKISSSPHDCIYSN